MIAATLQQVAGWVYLPKGEVLETNAPGSHSIGVRRPLGVVASFTPWNGAMICEDFLSKFVARTNTLPAAVSASIPSVTTRTKSLKEGSIYEGNVVGTAYAQLQ
ncbi:MAG TPA: aldehyde dehydrogenase family protein [Bryobacteraceae bacterium]|nr:aldehyde dehydrogenase family protein [Bryobacteraceae bacterium]